VREDSRETMDAIRKKMQSLKAEITELTDRY
jgi:hypothetical protein